MWRHLLGIRYSRPSSNSNIRIYSRNIIHNESNLNGIDIGRLQSDWVVWRGRPLLVLRDDLTDLSAWGLPHVKGNKARKLRFLVDRLEREKGMKERGWEAGTKGKGSNTNNILAHEGSTEEEIEERRRIVAPISCVVSWGGPQSNAMAALAEICKFS